MSTTPNTDAPPGSPSLRRGAIGLTESVVFAIAGAAPGQVIAVSLSALVIASAYGGIGTMLIATAAMLCIAVSFQRLNLWEQNAGGSFSWVARALNPYIGFLIGWVMLVGYVLTVLLSVITLGPSILGVLGVDTSHAWGTIFIAVTVGAFLTVVSARGLELSARFQLIIGAIQYLILGAFAVMAFYWVFIAKKPGTVAPSMEWLSPSGHGGGSLAAGMIVAVFFFACWDVGIYLNEETERPQRNPGKAALIAVAALAGIYIVMIAAFQGVVPQEDLEAHSENAVSYIAGVMTGGLGERIMSFAVALSVVAGTQAVIVATARIAFSMARDQVLPSALGKVSERYKTPVVATVGCGVVSIVFACVYVLASSVAGALDDLIEIVGLLFVIFYAVTGVAAPWYYRRQLFTSVKTFVFSGLLPMIGAATLAWVAYESIIGLEGGPLVALLVTAVSGLVFLFIAAVIKKSPLFTSRMQVAPMAGPATVPDTHEL